MCRAKEFINGTIVYFNSVTEDFIIMSLSLNGYSMNVILSFSVYSELFKHSLKSSSRILSVLQTLMEIHCSMEHQEGSLFLIQF